MAWNCSIPYIWICDDPNAIPVKGFGVVMGTCVDPIAFIPIIETDIPYYVPGAVIPIPNNGMFDVVAIGSALGIN